MAVRPGSFGLTYSQHMRVLDMALVTLRSPFLSNKHHQISKGDSKQINFGRKSYEELKIIQSQFSNIFQLHLCWTKPRQRIQNYANTAHLPHKLKVDDAKYDACHTGWRWIWHACHTDWRSMLLIATLAAQRAATQTGIKRAPPEPAQCHKSTPATQSEGRCCQVPRLPHRMEVDAFKCRLPQIARRCFQMQRLPHRMEVGAFKCHVCHTKGRLMSPSATPASDCHAQEARRQT